MASRPSSALGLRQKAQRSNVLSTGKVEYVMTMKASVSDPTPEDGLSISVPVYPHNYQSALSLSAGLSDTQRIQALAWI